MKIHDGTHKGLSRRQIAWRAAQDLRDGDYVNLGIGLPTMVTNYVAQGREVVFHSETGLIRLSVLTCANDPIKGDCNVL